VETKILIRRGCYNLLDPKEESINFHIRVGEKYINVDCKPEYGEYLEDWKDSPIELAEELLCCLKKEYLYHSGISKLPPFIEEMKKNEADIMVSWLRGRQKSLQEKLDRITKEKDTVAKELKYWEGEKEAEEEAKGG
jgi:hypothetical protein